MHCKKLLTQNGEQLFTTDSTAINPTRTKPHADAQEDTAVQICVKMPNNLVLPKQGSKASSSRASSKSSRTRVTPALSFTPALLTLTAGKASRVLAAFISFHYLQDRVALPLYLLFVALGASACLLALQRPWSGKRIGTKRAKRVILSAGILAATLYVWTAGLRSAGPLRTLLVDGAELPLLYLFALVSRRELADRRKTRGALCMLAAYCLLIWDASGHVPDVGELERSALGRKAEMTIGRIANKTSSELSLIAHLGAGNEEADGGKEMKHGRRRLLSTYSPRVKGSGGVRDAFVEGTALRCEIGVILVLVASVMMQCSRAFTRRLATELGGAKRQFALSCTGACAWLLPLALASWMWPSAAAMLSLSVSQGGGMDFNAGHAVGFAGVGLLWLVVPYYVRAVVSTALAQRTMLQCGVVIPFVMACVGSLVVGDGASAGGVSWVLLAAFVLDAVGISIMMAAGVKRNLSELPIDAASSVVSVNQK